MSATREAIAASRIPKQKVLNIKIKENQFVPMTVTNRDRDSFKFSATHFMHKLNGNGNGSTAAGGVANQSNPMNVSTI